MSSRQISGRSRVTALRFFHRGVLLSILFTEVFMFYRNQAAALAVLAFNLFSWACVNVVLTATLRGRTGHDDPQISESRNPAGR